MSQANRTSSTVVHRSGDTRKRSGPNSAWLLSQFRDARESGASELKQVTNSPPPRPPLDEAASHEANVHPLTDKRPFAERAGTLVETAPPPLLGAAVVHVVKVHDSNSTVRDVVPPTTTARHDPPPVVREIVVNVVPLTDTGLMLDTESTALLVSCIFENDEALTDRSPDEVDSIRPAGPLQITFASETGFNVTAPVAERAIIGLPVNVNGDEHVNVLKFRVPALTTANE
jgi:hypothetical protein